MAVKTNLKDVRLMRKVRQKQIAAAIGLCPRSISNIERGEYCPTLENALRIAKFLQVNVEDIFTLEDDENPAV